MSDAVKVALIMGAIQLVGSLLVYFKVDRVHTEMNGLQKQLLRSAKYKADALGHARGIKERRSKRR